MSKKLHEELREAELSQPKEPESIAEQIKSLANRAFEGYDNELKVFIELKKLEILIIDLKSQLLESALIEFNKHGNNEVRYLNCKISKSSGGKYYYSNSKQWKELDKKIKELQTKMQNAYKSGGILLDEETGEVFEPAIYKANKTSLKIEL